MSDQHKLAILKFISQQVTPATLTRFSFNSLGKSLSLPKQEVEALLVELNKQRFISQYSKKGVDGFVVVLNQKGIDAVQDESFI